MTDEQLSALLRLKRYEQPGEAYFEGLLQNIHRRQRAELLHRPLWKIAAERLQTFFSEHSMGHLSYAGAMASVLIAGVAGIGFLTSGGAGPQASAPGAPAHLAYQADLSPKRMLSLQGKPGPALESAALPAAPDYSADVHQPRYVIDARPVSYESSSPFNF